MQPDTAWRRPISNNHQPPPPRLDKNIWCWIILTTGHRCSVAFLQALEGLLVQGHSEPLWSVNVGCIYSHEFFASGQSDFERESRWVTSNSLQPHGMDYIVHGIIKARILEWVAFLFSRRSSKPRNQMEVSCIAGGLTMKPPLGNFPSTHSPLLCCWLWLPDYEPNLNPHRASLVAQLEKNMPAMQTGFNPWVGRSPGEKKGYPFQYSGLDNSVDWL